MYVVINREWGGFSLPDDFCAAYGINPIDSWKFDRTDARLINWIVEHGGKQQEYCNLRVVRIPTEATDWKIFDNDGMETIFYVLEGKIYTM